MVDIKQTLIEQSEQHDIKILYACESGSRAWGFPSLDSDYDVRFIYLRSETWYLSLFEQPDVIEQPINDLLDIGGWDLKKALQLLYKSNAPLIEWLHSPVVYLEESKVLAELRSLARKSFLPLSISHHYLSMARKSLDSCLGHEEVKFKKYFYGLRALLCCKWIINQNAIPPVNMLLILNEFYSNTEFYTVVNELLEIKANSSEVDIFQRKNYISLERKIKALLLECLESYYGSLSSYIIDESEAVSALRDINKVLSRLRDIKL